MRKNYIKSLITLSVACLSISALAGCGSSSPSSSPAPEQPKATDGTKKVETKTMRVGSVSSETSFNYKALQKFKESAEKYSNGTIKVEIYPNSQLGGQLPMVQQAQSGSLEATLASTAVLGNIVPVFSILDLPFLFKDVKVSDKVLDGSVGQKILDQLQDKKVVGLGYWEVGFRDLTNSKRPIKSLNDLKDLKIRVMENPMHLDLWKALGANPTPMSFDQVFNALQQKVLDGQENPVQTIYSSKLYEAQKYITLTHHVYSTEIFTVSKSWFDGLTKEQQDAIKKAEAEAREYDRQLSREEAKQNIDGLKQKGMEFNDVSPEFSKEIDDKVKPVIDKYSKQYPDISGQLFQAIKDAESK